MSSLPRDVPATFAATRDALHRVAEQVIAPYRVQVTGNEIALEPAPGGFGTPELPDGTRVAVDGTDLVAGGRRAPLTSLRAAGEHVGLHAAGALPDEPLGIDAGAAALLARWYAFAADVLAALAGKVAEPSPAILWPEHFDVAIEGGVEAEGTRATYGASPGDDEHPEPYLYVAPWVAQDGPLWQATGFAGAELGYRDLAAAEDPAALALDFFAVRRDALG